LRITSKWLVAAGIGALMGYGTSVYIEHTLRWQAAVARSTWPSLPGFTAMWDAIGEASIAAGVIACVLIFGLAIRLWPRPDRSSSSLFSRAAAAALGILSGTASGLAIAILTFYGPALVIPEYSMLWFWISWAVAFVAGSLGAMIIGRFVHRAVGKHADLPTAK
jgi:hypothetical protein